MEIWCEYHDNIYVYNDDMMMGILVINLPNGEPHGDVNGEQSDKPVNWIGYHGNVLGYLMGCRHNN